MKFYRLHEDPDSILVTPQYNRHYGEKLKEEFPGYEIVESVEVPLGYSYLFNKKTLEDWYNKKVEIESRND